jgi:16S rRNA (cytidine1402-2'-O)-methyltransferase
MKLYIVPTPVGNMQDITFRAIETLKNVDLILAEDTRTSGKLLRHYDISTKTESYHKFNEHQKVSNIINKLKAGQTIALISDAGTPGISDPGFLLIREAVKNNIDIETLPGATAFVPALVDSALPCEKFVFEGFLPVKKGRQKRLAELADEKRTMIFYESPFRITKTLEDFAKFFGNDRQISISREISKIHEETIRGSIEQLINIAKNRQLKGEFVIVVQGKNPKNKKNEQQN